MLGVSAGPMANCGDGSTAASREIYESSGASGCSSEVGVRPGSVPGGGVMEESDRNRWPRQETLALLKIRSEMDCAFRDSSLKGPLWEQISRKMAELGFHRSSKKCKEKFENVYKYHKRTKDGRSSKSYRFFNQLEGFENTPPPPPAANLQIPSSNITVPSACSPPAPLTIIPNADSKPTNNPINQSPFQTARLTNGSLRANSTSSTSSDEPIQRRGRSRKRKWRDYFERLTVDLLRRQEEMQNTFLDALERRERDRVTGEEAWRTRETARIRRERDLLVQEWSKTSARDTDIIAFLQKVPISTAPEAAQSENPRRLSIQPRPPRDPAPAVAAIMKVDISENNPEENLVQTSSSSSRWPKSEIEALIKIRTSLDFKYQENGPKGPLWEEISSAMAKIGFVRNAKRCKEKWENINKYYRKVKESNRRRPQDSKTCPYFHLLEEIYKVKDSRAACSDPGYGLKPDNPMAPIMALPEQQWPLSEQQHPLNSLTRDNDSDPNNDDYDDDDDEDGEDEERPGCEFILNTQQPPSSMANTVE